MTLDFRSHGTTTLPLEPSGDRILLKRESGRLAKAVIKDLGCKCNQVGVAVTCLNIAEYLVDQTVDRLEIGLLRLLGSLP